MEYDNYEQMTILALRNLAREKGITRYSRLRKSELIKNLREPILDRDINARIANMTFLAPTPYVPPQATPTPSPSSNAVKDLLNYLNNVDETPISVSPNLRNLLGEIESIYKLRKLFKFVENNSALNEFARVYTINGIKGYDAQSFL